MKKALIILALALALTLISCQQEEIYPRTMVVYKIDHESDFVMLKDSTGLIWGFNGVEDWEIGDICSCILNTNGTEIIYDDTIVNTRYNGQLEDLNHGFY